jgi:hypothetical protein
MKSLLSSRRQFLTSGAIGTATLLSAGSWSRVYGANEKLRLAAIGCGGKGKSDLEGVAARSTWGGRRRSIHRPND